MTTPKTADILDYLNKGKWIKAGAKDLPEIAALLQQCADLCHRYNTLPNTSTEADREKLLRQILGSFEERIVLHPPFRCDFGFNIKIGKNFMGNFNLTILDEARVTIGDNVMVGPNCSLITITHSLDANQRNAGVMSANPITIGNNVWIAANVVILPGVTIGDGAVIGAGSVVTKNIPAGVLAMGVPCRPVRSITDSDKVEVTQVQRDI